MPLTALAIVLFAASAPQSVEQACVKGSAAACDELGTRLRDGLGIRRDEARAAELFRRSCEGKDRNGCADDARALALGDGVDANPRAALPRLEQMCKADNPRACGHLGEVFARGLGGPQDAIRSDGLLQGACDKGAARACVTLASLLLLQGKLERAEEMAQRGCDLGEPAGCAYLGDLFARSHDVVRASVYFGKACEAGSAHGCAGQGSLLIDSGVDAKRGRTLLQKGCDGGDTQACEAVAKLK